MMKSKWAVRCSGICLILITALLSASAGDVFGGKVTAVRSAEIMVVDYGKGQYLVRIAGVAAPLEGPLAAGATEFVSKLVLGKEIRARFVGRNKNGEMVARVFVGDPGSDVGLELVRNGLARRQAVSEPELGYKYGELAKAEVEAREAKRGLWATAQPQ
jgi:endonuclease YncB( thermonuclease family)